MSNSSKKENSIMGTVLFILGRLSLIVIMLALSAGLYYLSDEVKKKNPDLEKKIEIVKSSITYPGAKKSITLQAAITSLKGRWELVGMPEVTLEYTVDGKQVCKPVIAEISSLTKLPFMSEYIDKNETLIYTSPSVTLNFTMPSELPEKSNITVKARASFKYPVSRNYKLNSVVFEVKDANFETQVINYSETLNVISAEEANQLGISTDKQKALNNLEKSVKANNRMSDIWQYSAVGMLSLGLALGFRRRRSPRLSDAEKKPYIQEVDSNRKESGQNIDLTGQTGDGSNSNKEKSAGTEESHPSCGCGCLAVVLLILFGIMNSCSGSFIQKNENLKKEVEAAKVENYSYPGARETIKFKTSFKTVMDHWRYRGNDIEISYFEQGKKIKAFLEEKDIEASEAPGIPETIKGDSLCGTTANISVSFTMPANIPANTQVQVNLVTSIWRAVPTEGKYGYYSLEAHTASETRTYQVVSAEQVEKMRNSQSTTEKAKALETTYKQNEKLIHIYKVSSKVTIMLVILGFVIGIVGLFTDEFKPQENKPTENKPTENNPQG